MIPETCSISLGILNNMSLVLPSCLTAPFTCTGVRVRQSQILRTRHVPPGFRNGPAYLEGEPEVCRVGDGLLGDEGAGMWGSALWAKPTPDAAVIVKVSVPDRREGVEALGDRPREALGLELVLHVARGHIHGQRWKAASTSISVYSVTVGVGQEHTIACDVAFHIGFGDVAAALADDDAELNCKILG